MCVCVCVCVLRGSKVCQYRLGIFRHPSANPSASNVLDFFLEFSGGHGGRFSANLTR